MADFNKLLYLANSVPTEVNLAASGNALQVDILKVGSTSPTSLTKAILDRLVSLQNGTDVDATYHTHDGRYFTESELGSSTSSSGSDLIGDDNTYTNFTPAAATVKGALSGIDTALANSSDGKVKISANDTTRDFLNPSLLVDVGTNSTNALEKSIVNPSADEQLRIRFDASKVDHGALAGLGDDDHTQYILVNGSRAFSGDQSLGGNQITNLGFGTANGEALAYEQAVRRNGNSGDFTASGVKIANLADPTNDQDAATKIYVDTVALGLKPKKAVRVATTGAGTLASSFENGDTIDGITLVTGDRILIKNQASAAENGIYTVNASGAPTRATDFDSLTPVDEINGAWVAVQEGTANAGRIYVQYGSVTALGTSPINFEFYNPLASLTGGDGITVTGSDISVDHDGQGLTFSAGQLALELDGSTLSKSASGVKVADNGITATQLNTSVAGAGLAGGGGTALSVNTNASFGTEVVSDEVRLKISGTSLEFDGANGARVNVDDTTIETAAGGIQVKDAGVTEAKLSASVAGDGLTGGAGTALAVGAGDGISVTANAVAVQVSALAGTGLEDDGSNNLRIAASAAGNGLVGGGGSALAVGAGDGIAVAADSISVTYAPRGLMTATAGEAMAANTSFLVRWARTGETAGRAYKADRDASTNHNFYAFGIALKSTAVSAGDSTFVTFEGTHTLGSGDTNFGAGDVGKPVYLTASGAFSVTAPTGSGHAVYRIGIVQDVDKIWVGNGQLNGILA